MRVFVPPHRLVEGLAEVREMKTFSRGLRIRDCAELPFTLRPFSYVLLASWRSHFQKPNEEDDGFVPPSPQSCAARNCSGD